MSMKNATNGMGRWKTNTNPFKWRDGKSRATKPSHTASKLGRTYRAFPPPEGWPGGDPSKNGLKGGGGSK